MFHPSLSSVPSTYPAIFWALGYTEELNALWKRNIAGSLVILFTLTVAGAWGGVGTTLGYGVVAMHGMDPVWTAGLVLASVGSTAGNYWVFYGTPMWVQRLLPA